MTRIAAKRVKDIQNTLEHYNQLIGGEFKLPVDGEPETTVGDFLGDLLHWCKAKQVNFEEALRRGRNFFESEDRICEECGQGHAIDDSCPDDEDYARAGIERPHHPSCPATDGFGCRCNGKDLVD